MWRSHRLFAPCSGNNTEINSLLEFYQDVHPGQHVLVIVGGGTAALTYLYTADLDPKYSHVVILGERGYWKKASHRLAQPQHILALPHIESDAFQDPAKHDNKYSILPHESNSAYVHSQSFQARLKQLEKATVDVLNKKGTKIFIAKNVWVEKIDRLDSSNFKLEIGSLNFPIFILANKIIISTGAGPSRKLPPNLQASLTKSAEIKGKAGCDVIADKIMTYTDILTGVAKKCRDKHVLIYGGGATAAWAMEVAALTAKPLAWIAKKGFDEAINAGPRVKAIIEKSRAVQIHGLIEDISYQKCAITGKEKLFITVLGADSKSASTTKYFLADYLVNCIGQEPYEPGGLPDILAQSLKNELAPYLDKNYVTGTEQSCMLGWATDKGDLMIIGAAQGTYYERDKEIDRPPSASGFLPRSAQVPITIGGVVSSVCALTNYMPLSQDAETGDVNLLSLNLHIMNATQLAVYFTAYYPCTSATTINKAVSSFISERSKTEFGLSKKQLAEFLQIHFGHDSQTNAIPGKDTNEPQTHSLRRKG
jgi:hypothetical protein